MIKAVAVACLLLLSGCEPSAPQIDVPISAPLKIQLPRKPKLLSADLTVKSAPMVVAHACYVDLDALIDYSTACTNLLSSANGQPR